ncbi:hypothetical protein RNL71_001750 [Vibrio cholerae]|uniref:hypothetical protein n=2 Tax=Vibrio cholerae TaxID=666 RepID=UPI003BA24D10
MGQLQVVDVSEITPDTLFSEVVDHAKNIGTEDSADNLLGALENCHLQSGQAKLVKVTLEGGLQAYIGGISDETVDALPPVVTENVTSSPVRKWPEVKIPARVITSAGNASIDGNPGYRPTRVDSNGETMGYEMRDRVPSSSTPSASKAPSSKGSVNAEVNTPQTGTPAQAGSSKGVEPSVVTPEQHPNANGSTGEPTSAQGNAPEGIDSGVGTPESKPSVDAATGTPNTADSKNAAGESTPTLAEGTTPTHESGENVPSVESEQASSSAAKRWPEVKTPARVITSAGNASIDGNPGYRPTRVDSNGETMGYEMRDRVPSSSTPSASAVPSSKGSVNAEGNTPQTGTPAQAGSSNVEPSVVTPEQHPNANGSTGEPTSAQGNAPEGIDSGVVTPEQKPSADASSGEPTSAQGNAPEGIDSGVGTPESKPSVDAVTGTPNTADSKNAAGESTPTLAEGTTPTHESGESVPSVAPEQASSGAAKRWPEVKTPARVITSAGNASIDGNPGYRPTRVDSNGETMGYEMHDRVPSSSTPSASAVPSSKGSVNAEGNTPQTGTPAQAGSSNVEPSVVTPEQHPNANGSTGEPTSAQGNAPEGINSGVGTPESKPSVDAATGTPNTADSKNAAGESTPTLAEGTTPTHESGENVPSVAPEQASSGAAKRWPEVKTPARVITSAGNASIDGNPGYRPTRVDSNGETMGYEMRDRVPSSSTPSASKAPSSKGSVNAEGNTPQTGTPAQAGSSNVEPSVATPEQHPNANGSTGEPTSAQGNASEGIDSGMGTPESKPSVDAATGTPNTADSKNAAGESTPTLAEGTTPTHESGENVPSVESEQASSSAAKRWPEVKTPARVITSAGNASIDGNPGYRPTRVDSNGETMGYEMHDRVPSSSTPSASAVPSSKGSVNAEGNTPQTGTPAQAGSSNVEPSVVTPEQHPNANGSTGEPTSAQGNASEGIDSGVGTPESKPSVDAATGTPNTADSKNAAGESTPTLAEGTTPTHESGENVPSVESEQASSSAAKRWPEVKTPARVITSAGNASIDGNPGYRPTRVDSNGETMGYEMHDRVPSSSTPSASAVPSSKGSVNAEGNTPQTGTPAQAGSSNVEPSVVTPEQHPNANGSTGEPTSAQGNASEGIDSGVGTPESKPSVDAATGTPNTADSKNAAGESTPTLAEGTTPTHESGENVPSVAPEQALSGAAKRWPEVKTPARVITSAGNASIDGNPGYRPTRVDSNGETMGYEMRDRVPSSSTPSASAVPSSKGSVNAEGNTPQTGTPAQAGSSKVEPSVVTPEQQPSTFRSEIKLNINSGKGTDINPSGERFTSTLKVNLGAGQGSIQTQATDSFVGWQSAQVEDGIEFKEAVLITEDVKDETPWPTGELSDGPELIFAKKVDNSSAQKVEPELNNQSKASSGVDRNESSAKVVVGSVSGKKWKVNMPAPVLTTQGMMSGHARNYTQGILNNIRDLNITRNQYETSLVSGLVGSNQGVSIWEHNERRLVVPVANSSNFKTMS